jgi:hypothetical protein
MRISGYIIGLIFGIVAMVTNFTYVRPKFQRMSWTPLIIHWGLGAMIGCLSAAILVETGIVP